MFKRVRWMGMGAVAGVGASTWAQRRLRRTLQEHPSLRSGADVVSTARRLGRELSAALADGRQAMSEREAVLRAEIDARLGERAAPGPDATGAAERPALRIVDTTSGAPRPARPVASPGPAGAPPAPAAGRPPRRRVGRPPT